MESQVELGENLFVVTGMDAEFGGDRSDQSGFACFLAGYIDHITRLEIKAVIIIRQFNAVAMESDFYKGFDRGSRMLTAEI